MSWAMGWDSNWYRDIGYGVPAWCDQPTCEEKIDRGLDYVCGGQPYGGEDGCGLYFCGAHLWLTEDRDQLCDRCRDGVDPHHPKPDHPEWVQHKLADPSWAQWRAENPEHVAAMKAGAA
jgi:hypothetical protein